MISNFRVLGAGVWGLAFSDYLLKLGHNVEIFCRETNLDNKDLKGLSLSNISNNNIKSLDTLNSHQSSDEINIIAVNSKGFSQLLEKHKSYFNGLTTLVSLTKGLDHQSGRYFSDHVFDVLKNIEKYGLISGPSFAKDLCDGKKISVSFATVDNDLSRAMAKSTKSTQFEMIPTKHIRHIEIAGIIKNIAAILCGMADELFDRGTYTNTIIKKACEGAWNIGIKALNNITYGSNMESICNLNKEKDSIITSPGYIGDMILTCKQKQSRNYQFGKLIVEKNISIEEAKNIIGTVEGYDCCITLVEKSKTNQDELTNLLYQIINSQKTERKKILMNFLQA
jgi:glycerol-3-phosphate dehydrogenase (NAD(P)+)